MPTQSIETKSEVSGSQIENRRITLQDLDEKSITELSSVLRGVAVGDLQVVKVSDSDFARAMLKSNGEEENLFTDILKKQNPEIRDWTLLIFDFKDPDWQEKLNREDRRLAQEDMSREEWKEKMPNLVVVFIDADQVLPGVQITGIRSMAKYLRTLFFVGKYFNQLNIPNTSLREAITDNMRSSKIPILSLKQKV